MSQRYFSISYAPLYLLVAVMFGIITLVWVAGNQPLQELNINLKGDLLQFNLKK